MENFEKIIAKARENAYKAYSPYSNFCVGASLLCESGKIYGGCNIENSSFGATSCAERNAFYNAIFCGDNKFSAIAIIGFERNKSNFSECFPCGICRQIMSEFCSENFKIVLSDSSNNISVYSLSQINALPFKFKS